MGKFVDSHLKGMPRGRRLRVKLWIRLIRVQASLVQFFYDRVPAYRRWVDRRWD